MKAKELRTSEFNSERKNSAGTTITASYVDLCPESKELTTSEPTTNKAKELRTSEINSKRKISAGTTITAI